MKTDQKNNQKGTGADFDSKQNQENIHKVEKKRAASAAGNSKSANTQKEFNDTNHNHNYETPGDTKKKQNNSDVKTNEHSATKQDNSNEGTKK